MEKNLKKNTYILPSLSLSLSIYIYTESLCCTLETNTTL